MAVFMNYLDDDDDCILIEDDCDADDNIENLQGNQQNKSLNDDDDEIEIVFDSFNFNNNNNNSNNNRKRPYSALNEHENKENRMAVIDLTDDNDELNQHMKFKRRILKNYPALVVGTITGLQSYKLIQENEKRDKLKKLEEKVGELTTLSTTRIEAWLMEKGLVFQCQYCDKHKHPDGKNVKMTLLQVNIAEDGGIIYKWNRPCCIGDEAVMSLNHRGFFDGQLSPRSMLHLLHHWVILSKLSNVEKYIHNVPLINKIYHEFRAICTAAIHEHFEKFGGEKKVVEVCLIYVGVKNNSSSKKIKVVIVGVYDVATKKKIILAIPPPMPQKTDYSSIAILTRFIDCQSVIVVDRSVNKSFFTGVGFQYVYYPFIDGGIPVNNSKVVQSTRNVLHIFDASLSLLSIEEIQLCLNELIWRETWGTHSLEAYNNFLTHVSELTKVIENFKQQSTVQSVLHRIVANPYGHWKYSTLESCSNNKTINPAEQQVCSVRQPIYTEPESTEDVTSVSILEPFYYGTYPGDEVTVSEVNYSISCHLCAEKFSKNDSFIEHLIKHLLSKTCYVKIQVCTVCLKSFSSKLKLANHISNYHRNKPSETSCLICDEDFSFRFRLLEHMKNTHIELELPYRCSICDFMCSEQKKLSEHFSSFHNENYQLWCPVCFKIFKVIETKQDRRSYADLNHFTQHILRHLQKSFVDKCPQCAMQFIHTMAMEEHLKNNHGVSMKNVGVLRYSAIITERDTRVARDRTHSAGTFQFNNSRSLKAIVKMYNSTQTEEISIDGISPSFKCIDCEGALIDHKYNTRFNCKKCAYSSFCQQAMRYHTIDFHTKDFLKNSLLKYPENETTCTCGYFSKFGHKMAKHYDSCKYQLIEAFDENIHNNSVTSLVLLKKTVSLSKVESTPNVLLSLGLIKI